MVKNSIKVYSRIKRLNKLSTARNYIVQHGKDYHELVFNNDPEGEFSTKNCKHKFKFSKIFGEESTQVDVFDVVAKPVINSAIQGYNGTIFAYGQTGSGKTYSMTGAPEYGDRGIIPRTLQYIFNYISRNNSENLLYNIYISYLEIYNEIGYDLLNPKHRASYLEDLPRVTILEDAKGQTHLRNLGVLPIASEREAMCLLFLGDTNRTIAETPMNQLSSRSHCIFTVHIAATNTHDGRVRRSKLHLVDLAGSERIQKSAISGTLLVDARQINLSLHYLEQVIIALSDSRRAHVPYRNSMMTTVLKDSLGGNCLTVMLATLSMEPRNFEESLSTCKFAQRVALITSEAYINEEEDPSLQIADLKLEIENLKKELMLYKDPNNHFNVNMNENHELSQKDIKDCERELETYLNNTSDHFEIPVNIKKIPLYFKLFKKVIKKQKQLLLEDETNKLKINQFEDKIREKDHEISMLVNMLSKEKARSKEVDHSIQIPCNVSIPEIHEMSEKQAFDYFMRYESNKSEVNKCAQAMKQKIDTAKISANRIKICKNNIIALKKRLMENVHNCPEITNSLMSQLKGQQEIYRENILELHALKNETEHLQHGFQRAKMQMMQRFQKWRANEMLKNNNKPFHNNLKSPRDLYKGISSSPIIDIPSYNSTASSFTRFPHSHHLIPQDSVSSLFLPFNAQSQFTIDSFPSFYEPEPDCMQNFPSKNVDSSSLISKSPRDSSSFISQDNSGSFYSSQDSSQSCCSSSQTNYKDQTQRVNQNFSTTALPVINSNDNLKQTQNCYFEIKVNSPRKQATPETAYTHVRFSPEEIPKQVQVHNFTIPPKVKPVTPVRNFKQSSLKEEDLQYRTIYDLKQDQPYQCKSRSDDGYNTLNKASVELPEKLSNENLRTCQENELKVYYSADLNLTGTVHSPSNNYNDNYETNNQNDCVTNDVSQSVLTETDSSNEDFLKSVPLTGDQEVDEEILAFYRSKQKVINSFK